MGDFVDERLFFAQTPEEMEKRGKRKRRKRRKRREAWKCS